MINFYDTSSLLLKAESLFEGDARFAISSITLNELENIKTSNTKSEDVKYAARKLLHILDEHSNEYELVIFKNAMLQSIEEMDLSITNDAKILACANSLAEREEESVCFITNDLALKSIAKLFFDNIDSVKDEEDDYCGFKDVKLNTDEMSEFYSVYTYENVFNLLPNEYLIIRTSDGEIVDRLCWTGDSHRHLNYQAFRSKWFGDVRPMRGDVYQAFAADSLANNKITMLKGPAGSGKTYMAMAYLLYKLDRGDLDKIIVFCNTVATKNSAKLGFYPGTRDEKLLDSQIGNLLSSKFGDKIEVEKMISEGKLLLLPMSDIRGYDTSGMCAGIYISEAQNLDISLMKLALQRIGEDGICIIDGDCKTQVDDINFAGSNNGMRRASKVFRGEDIYGEVELRQIHRSRIAQVAERM